MSRNEKLFLIIAAVAFVLFIIQTMRLDDLMCFMNDQGYMAEYQSYSLF